MLAAEEGHISVVEYLTSQGGDIHAKDNVSKTILIYYDIYIYIYNLMTSYHIYIFSLSYVISMDTQLLCVQHSVIISLLSSISPLKEWIYMLRIM